MDMRAAIAPKSDQLNTDDLISGPRTIRIRDVKIAPGEQPVSIFFDGDDGKPWKPCKSMSRVLVAAWGPDASKYIGRSATLYRDPGVKWAGMAIGGIRVSHLSHMERDMAIALTETRGKKSPFTVRLMQPQGASEPKPQQSKRGGAEEWVRKQVLAIAKAESVEALESLVTADGFTKARSKLETEDQELAKTLSEAIERRFSEVNRAEERQPGED